MVNGDKVIHGYQKILKIEIYEGKTPLGSKYVDIVYLHLLFVNFFFFLWVMNISYLRVYVYLQRSKTGRCNLEKVK